MVLVVSMTPVMYSDISGYAPTWNQIGTAALIAVVAIVVIVAVVSTAGGAAGMVAMAATYAGASASAASVASTITVGLAYTSALVVGATAVSDIGEVLSGRNIIRDDILAGNTRAYNGIKSAAYITAGALSLLGSIGLRVKQGNINSKINGQMGRRGWTTSSINNTIRNPYHTSPSTNLATGNSATAFFNSDGSYVVRDNITFDIIQISNRYDPYWIPDSNITNPLN
jgi:hypothetical protein